MGSFSITLGFFLVLAFWLPGHIGANPVYSAVSNTDLMDFKDWSPEWTRLQQLPVPKITAKEEKAVDSA
ncbi:natriuretic peptide precursor type A, isoform CRA_a [Mus musculus]|nr:natriuretic peptide precursor type A, isoform CRA_a [Mus musculus]